MTTYKEVFQLAQNKGCKLYSYHFVQGREIWVMALIQKWLRDEHKINVSPDWDNQHQYSYHIYLQNTGLRKYWKYNFATYEQALLEGIAEALKLI